MWTSLASCATTFPFHASKHWRKINRPLLLWRALFCCLRSLLWQTSCQDFSCMYNCLFWRLGLGKHLAAACVIWVSLAHQDNLRLLWFTYFLLQQFPCLQTYGICMNMCMSKVWYYIHILALHHVSVNLYISLMPVPRNSRARRTPRLPVKKPPHLTGCRLRFWSFFRKDFWRRNFDATIFDPEILSVAL